MRARSLSLDGALQELAGLLLQMALAQTVPQGADKDAPDAERVARLAAAIDAESVQLYYQIATQGRQDLPLAPDEHAGFVMTLLRMLAFRPQGAAAELPRPSEPGGARSTARPPAAKPVSAASKAGDWPELAAQLQVTGAARELARNAELRSRDGGVFDLVVPKAKAYLADRAYQDKLKAALEAQLGTPVTVKVSVGDTAGASAAALEAGERNARQAEAARAVQADGFVQDLVNLFDGKVVDPTFRSPDK
jgi:DNA polymerase-3 subunit gamma/tau